MQARRQALAANFTHAVQVAAAYALGAIVLTYLLVFVLPRRRSSPPAAAGEWSPSAGGGA